MPSTSAKQARFMAAVAHNPKFARDAGVPQGVGKDFNNADKGRTFKAGGNVAKSNLFNGKETYGEELKEANAIKSGKITPQQYAKGEKKEDRIKSSKSKVPAFAAGGVVRKSDAGLSKTYRAKADGIAQQGRTKAKQLGAMSPKGRSKT